MSQQLVAFWLTAIMVVSAVAISAVIFITHTDFWHSLGKTFRVGVILIGLGLGVQTYRTLYFLKTGSYPIDEYFPLWAVKDIGSCLIIWSLLKPAFK